MLEFKLQYYFEKYKNSTIISTTEFKKKFKNNEGDFDLLSELVIMIQRYQLKKYGDLLPSGLVTVEPKGNGGRFKKELNRNRNRFGTKEERNIRKINERRHL